MPKYKCGQFISMRDENGDKWLCRIVQHFSKKFCSKCDFYRCVDNKEECIANEDDRMKCILHVPILSILKKVRICQKKE